MTDLPDEETIRVRRTYRGSAPRDPGNDDTVPSTADDDTEVPIRRRASYVEGTEHPTDGSTFVARRESRRREARRDAAETGEADPTAGARMPEVPASADVPGRVAAAGDEVADRRYPARPADPLIVPRTPPAGRTPQQPIDSAGTAAHRARSRRAAMIVVVAASVVAFAAAASLAAIALNP
jgi:hypothetical protein